MSDLIQVINLKKYFNTPSGKVHAVDQINISIPEGETLGVVGESGCGKSTLGRVILRLSEATSGQVLFEGKDILKFNKAQMKEARTKMQIIFQDPYSSLDPRMTVMDLIKEPLLINHMYKSREQLDGGRRQRIGVARALAVRPKFIVCDEPVSALDVSIQAQILNLLMDLQEEMGLTYLFITHDLSVVRHISNRIMVMYLGQCIETAPSEEIFNHPLHPYTKALLNAIPKPDLSCRDTPIQTIKGEVTSPIDPKPGCRFASRCEFAREECLGSDLELKRYDGEHFVACRLYESE